MKTKLQLVTISLLLFCGGLNAQTFTLNNLNYTVIDVANFKVQVDVNSCFAGNLTLPQNVQNAGNTYEVTRIASEAFKNCTQLTGITLPNSIEFIGSWAFASTNITAITIPNTVDEIYPDTFNNCKELTSVTLPNSVLEIEESAFLGCSKLTSIDLPDNLETIHEGAFEQTGLTSITIPDLVTEIKFHAFRDCFSLTSVNLGANLTTIGTGIFQRSTNLTDVTLNDKLTSISNRAFQECYKLESITIPNSVTIIEDYAFYKCYKLSNVTLSNAITSIDQFAFDSCNVLEEIEIPESVTSIQDFALSNNGLKKVTVNWQTPLAITSNVFANNNLANAILITPSNTKSLYQATDVWKDFGTVNELFNSSQYTSIPDPYFEQYLVQNNIDSEATIDGKVLTSDIVNVTQIDARGKNINDFTGLKDFTNLEILYGGGANLTSIDLSHNSSLKRLLLISNLTHINLSGNPALIELTLANNPLKTINLSSNSNLSYLDLTNTQLSSLDLSNLTELEILNLGTNNLTNIDVSKNTKLREFVIVKNKLTSLDVSLNTNLETCYVYENEITSLDFSKNNKLTTIQAYLNKLTYVDVKNGTNTIITDFEVQQNPDLTCINVDNVTYSQNNNKWTKDYTATYSENCKTGTYVSDANFENYLESIGVGNGVANDNYVNTSLVSALESLNVNGKNIASLEGLQDFTSLKNLDVSNNSISSIDLSNLVLLEVLDCSGNQLTNIDINVNTKIKELNVGNNKISSIDVSHLSDLLKLFVFTNQLTELNVVNNTKLEVLNCGNNQLENLNVYSNIELQVVYAYLNKLKNIDVHKNTKLVQLDVGNNELVGLNAKNGNNSNFSLFNAFDNTNLTCVEVDDVNYSTTNWQNKDNHTNYSLDCAPANDDCSFAIPLTFNQQTPGDINSGTANNNPSCAVGNVLADVWFSVVVPASGEFSIQGLAVVGNLKFAVYTNCTSVAPIACGESISLKNLTVGTKFYLKVWIESSSNKSANMNNDLGLFTLTASESSVLSIDNLQITKVDVLVYPNPANTNITVKMSDNSTVKQVDLYNLMGKRVMRKINLNNSDLTLDISSLSKGIYFVKTGINNKIVTQKLIIK